MNQISAKNAKQITLDGIGVEFTARDQQITEVRFTDASGHQCAVAISSYALHVYVPAPPKMVKRTRLHGTALGLSIDETFEHKFEAEAKKRDLGEAVRDEESLALQVEEIEVAEDEVPF